MEVVNYILGIVVVVIGLAVSIGLHEVGHLVPAKLFGVRVSQYMVGFGPTVWSKRFGETEYGFKAIPLGGYISMIGMYPPAKAGASAKAKARARSSSTGFFDTLVQDARTSVADELTPADNNRQFYQLSVPKRIVIMLGGPFMNLILAVILYAVLLCGFGTAQIVPTVASVAQCVQPASTTATECAEGDTPSPASAAGILPGDTILTWGSETITEWDQLTALIRSSTGQATSVTVDRDGTVLDLTVTPISNERYTYDDNNEIITDANGDPVTVDAGFVGVTPTQALVPQPITSVLPSVGDNVTAVAGMIINLPQRLIDIAVAAFGPGERDANGPMSVVGVGRVAGEINASDQITDQSKVATMVGLLASLNVALFVFNLVPLLPLDGGHVAGAAWESIRRRIAKLRGKPDPGPVDVAKMIPVTFAVVIVLGAMTALLIYADLVKPVNILG